MKQWLFICQLRRHRRCNLMIYCSLIQKSLDSHSATTIKKTAQTPAFNLPRFKISSSSTTVQEPKLINCLTLMSITYLNHHRNKQADQICSHRLSCSAQPLWASYWLYSFSRWYITATRWVFGFTRAIVWTCFQPRSHTITELALWISMDKCVTISTPTYITISVEPLQPAQQARRPVHQPTWARLSVNSNPTPPQAV